jgi:cobalt-zinc-cadmium efflux system outer membrane protein
MRKVVALLFTLIPSTAAADWPTLGTVIERARARSLAAVDAETQVRIAQAFREGATVSWLTNPYVEFQAYSPGTGGAMGGVQRELSFQSFAMIPIEINGQRPARIREADSLERWKSLSREETRARTMGFAVGLYGAALVARAKLDLAIRAEADAKAEADYFAARLRAGDATLVDQSLADAELAKWSQHHAEAALGLMSAREEVELILAMPDIGDPPSGPVDPPPLRAPTAEAIVSRVREQSPQLRTLGAEASFWRNSSDRASRDKNVPFSFIVNFGRTDRGDYQIGGGLAWMFPITQRAQGPVAIADASAGRADTLRSSSEMLVTVRARRLYEQYDLLRTTLDEVDKTGLPAQERVVDSTFGAYKAGKLEFVRVLVARRDLASARLRRLDLVYLAWRRYGELTALVGDSP